MLYLQQQGNNGEGLYRQMQPQLNRAQDDAMVSYIFQRNSSDATDLSLQQQPPQLAAPPQQPPPHLQSQQATAVPLSHLQGKFQQLRWPPSNDQIPDFVSIPDIIFIIYIPTGAVMGRGIQPGKEFWSDHWPIYKRESVGNIEPTGLNPFIRCCIQRQPFSTAR